MRSVSSRTAGWLRLFFVGGFAVALALAGGIAFGAPQGGARQVSTSAPDVTSFTVIKNGTPSGGPATAALCFDKPIAPASLGTGTVAAITLYGYGAGGVGPTGSSSPPSQKLPLAVTGATAASVPGNGACASITIAGGGIDLDGFTVAAVTQGAAKDAGGRASVQGAVGVTVPGGAEITPQRGETTGPKLVTVGKSGAQLTYVFNRFLDPSVGSSGYSYVTSTGTTVNCSTGATFVSPLEVTVTCPGSVAGAVRYSVAAGTVKTQTQDVPNPTDAFGPAVTAAPSIVRAAPVAGLPGSFDVTYNQAVTVANATDFRGYLEDNSTAPAVTVPPRSSSSVVRVTFGASVSKYASLIAKIADIGGAVKQATPGTGTSVPGEGDITTPPMRAGFTEGPDLISVALNPGAGTASYTFDGNYGSLYAGVTAGAFHLVNADGTLSAPATSASVTGANTVTAAFSASQFASAVGGTISGSGAVYDYEAADCHGCAASTNIAPVTAGGTTTTTTTLPAGKVRAVRVGLRASSRRIGGGRTRVSFKGRIYLGNAFNPAFCYGKVNITLRHQSRKVATKRVGVGYRRCTFGQSITVRNSQLRNDSGRVYALFTGNKFVFPISSGAAVF